MAEAFRRDPSDERRIVGRLDDVERAVVVDLMHQTSVLLSDGSDDAPDAPRGTDEDELFAALGRSMSAREAPRDPALRRLLPDGVKDDDGAAAEFRRLTEASLRDRKLRNLATAMTAFERVGANVDLAQTMSAGEPRDVVLDEAEARATMMALTDVRLVLAERLDVRTDADADALVEQVERGQVPNDEEQLMAAYYDFLTWLAESVTLAVMREA